MKTYRDPSWGWPSKIGALLVGLGLMWAAIPSSLFVNPVSMAVVKSETGRWTMISERETPLGPIFVRTDARIQVLGREDGLTCRAELAGVLSPKPNNVARYDIDGWAGPCLGAGPPISISFTRRAILGGVIPLRPVTLNLTITQPDQLPDLGAIQ